jgi:hypothetical protein
MMAAALSKHRKIGGLTSTAGGPLGIGAFWQK